MTAASTLATALRVLTQLRRDPRTVALLLVVPLVLMTIVRGVFDGRPATFQRVGVPLAGLFPLISMFLVTSVTMLRERTSGTLERLMTLPVAKLDLLAGYALAFGAMAAAQAALVCALALGVLGLHVAGPLWLVVALAVGNAMLGMALGLLVSAFAASEFQAVQFMPAVILPQLLLCGLLGPRAGMAGVLRGFSDALPMTYAYDALQRVARSPSPGARVTIDAIVITGSALLALALGAATMRRRTE